MPLKKPTGAVEAIRRKRFPPAGRRVADDPNDELEVETSKFAGAVAVMFSVRLVPVTATGVADEARLNVVLKEIGPGGFTARVRRMAMFPVRANVR